MSRKRRRRRPTPGEPPGTLHVDPQAMPTRVRFIAYGPQGHESGDILDLELLQGLRSRWPVVWIDVDGLGNVETIQRLGQLFGLHSLALEDVVHTHQRAKVDQYGDHCFIVARMLSRASLADSEQLSLFLGHGFVLTFQEQGGDCLEPVRARIREGSQRIRTAGADYLAYAILDAVLDEYFPVLESYGERVEDLEERVLVDPGREVVAQIFNVKHDLLAIRRAVWPLREAINELLRDTSHLFSDETKVFLRDTYDHTVQLIDFVETLRELGASLMEFYLSSIANRTNEVMRVLTIISTIFIPLSFIAGLWGMNFDVGASPWNMPELRWYFGYPFALAIMLAVAGGLLVYFYRKGWLVSSDWAADDVEHLKKESAPAPHTPPAS